MILLGMKFWGCVPKSILYETNSNNRLLGPASWLYPPSSYHLLSTAMPLCQDAFYPRQGHCREISINIGFKCDIRA